MAGLLKQLQRQKGKSEAEERGAVVRSSARDAFEDDAAIAEADLLLNSGFAADEPQPARRPGPERMKGTQTLLRDAAGGVSPVERGDIERSEAPAKKLRPDLDDTPWWLTEELKGNPQVDTLVMSALKELKIRPDDWAEESIVKRRVQEAVQTSANVLKDEIRMTRKLLEQTESELQKLLLGKGPLEPLFDDASVTDIFVDGCRSIKVLRAGHAIETPFAFRGEEEYRIFLTSLLRAADQTLDAAQPILDCVLNDKWRTRCNVIDSSLAEGGESRICFRVPRIQPYSFFDMLQTKTLPATVAAWLAELTAIRAANILVIGPGVSGKTVMLTALVSAVGSDERIVTVEQEPEIAVQNTHIERLVSRPNGKHSIDPAMLLETALRRSPRRIIVGDLRSGVCEAFIGALESGFIGSMASMTADNAEDALYRLVDSLSANSRASESSLMRRIARTIHLILTMRVIDGSPCLYEIAEVLADSGRAGVLKVQPILRFNGVVNGKRQWQLQTRRSHWLEHLRERGLMLLPGPSLLGPPVEQEMESEELEQEL